jgi:hypothetical protein
MLIQQEVKLLEEAGEGGSADVKELREARSTIDVNEQTIREVRRMHQVYYAVLILSSTEKSLNWKVSLNPRFTVKMNWNNGLTTSNVNWIDYVLQATIPPNMVTVTVVIAQSLPRGRTTMTDVNYVKVHIVWTLVLYSLEKLWTMYQRTRLESFVRIARYVFFSTDWRVELMRQSTEHDTVDCPLAEDVF